MRLDDIQTYIDTNVEPYCTALGLPDIPSTAYMMRVFQDPVGTISVLLEGDDEETEEDAPSFRIMRHPVTIYTFCPGGAAAATLRTKADSYASAILDCLKEYAYFFGITGRELFDGVEGKEDVKAAKLSLVFKYEESV